MYMSPAAVISYILDPEEDEANATAHDGKLDITPSMPKRSLKSMALFIIIVIIYCLCVFNFCQKKAEKKTNFNSKV